MGECIEAPAAGFWPHCGRWGKGFGKGCHAAASHDDGDASTSSTSTSVSEASHNGEMDCAMITEASANAAAKWKQNKAEFKRKKMAAKQEMKTACKEAKAKYKMQMKEAKQTLTRIKKADKAEKKVLKQQ